MIFLNGRAWVAASQKSPILKNPASVSAGTLSVFDLSAEPVVFSPGQQGDKTSIVALTPIQIILNSGDVPTVIFPGVYKFLCQNNKWGNT